MKLTTAKWLCRLTMTAAVLSMISSVQASDDDKIYNILAIDGGGIRGIIPA